MKIPNKLKIGGCQISVKQVSGFIESDNCYGQWYAAGQEI